MAVFKGFPGLTFQKVKFKYFKHFVRTLLVIMHYAVKCIKINQVPVNFRPEASERLYDSMRESSSV